MEEDLSHLVLAKDLNKMLRLLDGTCHLIVVDDEILDAKREEFKHCLVGKLLTNCSINLGIDIRKIFST